MTGLRGTPARRFVLRVFLYGGAVFVGLPLAFAHVMTRAIRLAPPQRPSPGYQESFLRVDGLRLRAWVASGDAARPAVVIVHGLGASIETELERASLFRARGLSVLLVDLRGHGGSQGSRTSLGGNERRDVLATIGLAREIGLARAGVVLVGHSMGAVAALRAAAGRDDVRAVVAEAPFDDYRSTIAHHAWLIYRIPGWLPIVPLAIAGAERLAGFDADDVDAVAAARSLRAPLLLIVDGGDPRMPEAVGRRVYDAHSGPKRLWIAPDVPHVGAILRPEYPTVVLGFLEEHGAI